MKKKVDVTIKCNDKDTFARYVSPDYNKIVVINVFDKFWGPCEVADPIIKRYLEQNDNNKRCDFICVDKDFTGSLFEKIKFASQPKFFVSHKGEILHTVEGLDFPKLLDSVEKSYALLEEQTS